MEWKIKKAIYKPDYSVEIEFMDGYHGVLQIKQSRLFNAFTPLKDINMFLKGYIKYGALTWNAGDYELDLAPDAMYERMKQNNGIDVLA
jgi:hypothetical protein